MTVGKAIDTIAARTTRAWDHPSWWNLLVVLPWTFGLIFLVHEWRTDTHVAERQQTTSGVITAYEPANHNQYDYTFKVDGKSYNGQQSPKHDELAIGKTAVVYYDPQDPRRNALTDFHELSIESLGPVPVLLFGIGSVAAFIVYRRRMPSDRKSS